MGKTKNILLASHGTIGAQAAEQVAFSLCSQETHVTHLYVVPEFWKDILGDDWLNNQSTQERFGHYLESELGLEADQNITRIHKCLHELGASSDHQIKLGEPKQCLVSTYRQFDFDMVIMGSPRPKTMPGLKSRMTTRHLPKQLSASVLQVPHPNINE